MCEEENGLSRDIKFSYAGFSPPNYWRLDCAPFNPVLPPRDAKWSVFTRSPLELLCANQIDIRTDDPLAVSCY